MSSEPPSQSSAEIPADVPTVLVHDSRGRQLLCFLEQLIPLDGHDYVLLTPVDTPVCLFRLDGDEDPELIDTRSEEHTSELQSSRSYAVFCLKKKKS